MAKKLFVGTHTLPIGFEVRIGSKNIRTSYPREVWSRFPQALKTGLAQTAAHFFTHHFALRKNTEIVYDFPQPAASSLFFHGLLYSVAESALEFPEAKFTTSGLLRDLYNSNFRVRFTGLPDSTQLTRPFAPDPKRFVMAFSFGKDSLLTYSVTKEIGLTALPFFFVEPTSPYENVNKGNLRKQFLKEFGVSVAPFQNALGSVRDEGGQMWGWDMLLTQYTLLLLPYVCYHKAEYFFWSNERSINEYEVSREGYYLNPTHEQSVDWVLHLNNLYRMFGVNTKVASLLEPIHELAILSVLHHRYPEIGKYQLSCLNDTDKPVNKRWCGDCYECARVFIFLLAVGIDPKRVGFEDNMLGLKKKKHFYLFDKKPGDLDTLFQSQSERLLALYISHKRGVRGPIMELFVRQLLPFVERNKKALFDKYLTVHTPTRGVPRELESKILPIFRKEVDKLREEVTSEHPAPVGISV